MRVVAGNPSISLQELVEAPVLSPATIFTSTITTIAFSAWYGTSKRTFVVVGKGEMLPNVSKGYDQTR